MKKVYLIVDDVGSSIVAIEYLHELISNPRPVALSLLPGAPLTPYIVGSLPSCATPMIHVPGQGSNLNLWPGELRTSDSEELLVKKLDGFYRQLPFRYANFHRSSAVCNDERCVDTILRWSRDRDVRIIDSLTSATSLFSSVARSIGLAVAVRSVFLEKRDVDWELVADPAVAIVHGGDVLFWLERLAGCDLRPVSDLFPSRP